MLLNKSKPISPHEVLQYKAAVIIPGVMIEVFNDLIARHYSNGRSRVTLTEAKELAEERGVDITQAFKEHWFDVEEIYIKSGWKVKYTQPAYCENFEAYYIFECQTKTLPI